MIRFALAALALLLFQTPSIAQDLFGLEASNEHQIAYFSPETSQDPDVKRAISLGLMSARTTLHAQVNFVEEDASRWKLQVFQNARLPEGPTFFVPHDSEDEAFLSAAWANQRYGGHIISLECGETRSCDKDIDPNRYFRQENRLYVSTIMRFFEEKAYPVITLHNNHDSHHSLGGQGAIYADLETPYSDGHGFYNSGDPDDLIIYADTKPPHSSQSFSRFNEEFRLAGLNSIFEFISEQNALGGHMSTHVIKSTPMEYFNVEAQHGHLPQQIDYIEALLEILGIF